MRALTETQALVVETLEEAMNASAAAKALHQTVQSEGEALAERLRLAGDDAVRRIEAAASAGAGKLRDSGVAFHAEAQQLNGVLRATVQIVGRGTNRLVLSALLTGAGAGALAGVAVAFLAAGGAAGG